MAETQVKVPGGFAPGVGVMFGAVGTAAQAVDAAHPLPVTLGGGVVAVTGVAPAAPIAVTIPAGEGVSAPVDLGDQRLLMVMLPTGWTPAALSFQVSATGDAFVDLYDMAGELVVPATVAGAGRAIMLPASVFHGVRYLRLRSGVSGGVVAQAGARTITLATVAR